MPGTLQKALSQMAEDYEQKKAVFERLPRPIQAFIKAGQTVRYYIDIAFIVVVEFFTPLPESSMHPYIFYIKL